MSNLEVRQAVIDYLREGKLLHISTSSNGIPWLCHVWYALDEKEPALLFASNRSRRHSREIVANSVVAGGVVGIELEGLGQKVRGLSFEGRAVELSGSAIAEGYEVYRARWPNVKDMFSVHDIETASSDMRIYRVSLSRAVLFDEVLFPRCPRQETSF
jgi:uncharacterized protein YhbP (UPF0306 family)